MRPFHLLVPLVLLLAAPVLAETETLPDEPRVFPILAWGGPPQAETTPERFRELAECGFTYNYSGYSSDEAVAKALDVCKLTGVKLIPSWPQLQNDPEGAARRFKTHPGLGGYYLRDEPAAVHFPELAAWAKRVQSVDAEHPCYINLYPNYAPPDALGTPTYQAYVDRFLAEVPVPFISFDHYPVVGNSLRGEWYQNLEIVSAAARKADKPFWAFALSVAHGAYPVPTVAHLRVQAYSNLAYGAQGLQYFTYWTTKSDTWDFHEGPILPDGKRSATYDRVREVNREVQALRTVFLGAKVESVGHTGATPPVGTRRYEAAPPVRSLSTHGQGAAVSVLSKGDRRFLVIVNRDINQPTRLELAFDPRAGVRRVNKAAELTDPAGAANELEVAPGDAAIFAWVAR
jgi:hypothetical protein